MLTGVVGSAVQRTGLRCICRHEGRRRITAAGCPAHDPCNAKVKSRIEPPQTQTCQSCRHWRGYLRGSGQYGFGDCNLPRNGAPEGQTYRNDVCNFHEVPKGNRALTHGERFPHEDRSQLAAGADQTTPSRVGGAFSGTVIIDDAEKGGSHAGAYAEAGYDVDRNRLEDAHIAEHYVGGSLGQVPSGPLFSAIVSRRHGGAFVVTGMGLALRLDRASAVALRDTIDGALEAEAEARAQAIAEGRS